MSAPAAVMSIPLLSECRYASPGSSAAELPEFYQKNVANRMEIVAGLGGEAAVRAIRPIDYPYIDANKKTSSEYMDELEQTKFRPGESIVQTEDGIGRKAIVLLLVHKDDPTNQAV